MALLCVPSRMRVVVTDRRFPDRDPFRDVVNAAGGELVYGDCTTEDEAVERCRDADVIVARYAPVTGRVMDAAGDPRLVMRTATGYDNIDVRAATARGVPVSNVPGYAPRDVASHAFALALSAAHDIPSIDRRLRAGTAWGDVREELVPLHGGTFGVVGLGRIGRETVPLARGFDMDVVAYDPYLADDVFGRFGVEPVSFEALLARSDCVSIHAPLTQVTHHLFSADEFGRMKDSAVLVNAARGPIVDEVALVDAVESGELRAAALDVSEREPPGRSPVLACDGIVCSPHRGGHTRAAEERVVEIAAAELDRVLRGETLHNVVNPDVFQYRGGPVTDPDAA